MQYVRCGASYPFSKYNFKCLKVIIALLQFNIQWREAEPTAVFHSAHLSSVAKQPFFLSSKACLTSSNVCKFFNSLKIRFKKKNNSEFYRCKTDV